MPASLIQKLKDFRNISNLQDSHQGKQPHLFNNFGVVGYIFFRCYVKGLVYTKFQFGDVCLLHASLSEDTFYIIQVMWSRMIFIDQQFFKCGLWASGDPCGRIVLSVATKTGLVLSTVWTFAPAVSVVSQEPRQCCAVVPAGIGLLVPRLCSENSKFQFRRSLTKHEM